MPPNKKTQRAEIDDFMHIRESFPQMSFDLGHQGEMTIAPGEQGPHSGFDCKAIKMPTRRCKNQHFQNLWFLIRRQLKYLLLKVKGYLL